MTSTGEVGSAFKLTHFAGSYWRGDAQGQRLQRILPSLRHARVLAYIPLWRKKNRLVRAF